MDFEFSEDQEELRQSVRAVLDKECPVSLIREVVEKGVETQELWSKMVELDWPALVLPEEVGGLGLGFIELTVVLEELGRVLDPTPFLATVTQFAPAVKQAGSPEQRARFLGAVVKGSLMGTLAVAEEDGRWPPDAMACTATAQAGGWVLRGRKKYVADADRADELVVAAAVRNGGEPGPGLFVVPRSAVTVTLVSGLDASLQYGAVELDGAVVGEDRVLATGQRAASALQRALEEATCAMAVGCVGTCQSIFDMTLDYVKHRQQFGVPVGSFQAVKHKMADMFVALERARAVAYFAAMTIAEDDDRRTLATAMAKAAAGECQRLVVQDGLQLHGGIGYTWEYDLHLYLKRAKSSDALFGTAAHHRARVAQLIGL